VILAGDIGGTKTVLGLFRPTPEGLVLEKQASFASRRYDALEAVIDEFRQRLSLPPLTAAGFGVAGPVVDGVCRTTNLPWAVSAARLADYLGGVPVYLLNDLEAAAVGMLHLPDDQFADLNPEGRARPGNRAVIAAGTGLGEALLYWDGRRFHPMATEGGHCDFAPTTPRQDRLLRWLRERHPAHVSVERVLSGDGIGTLYDFLREVEGMAPAPAVTAAQGDRNAAISACALRGEAPICREALALFVAIYGAEAGNLALKGLATGGVYVGGGIAPRILPLLRDGRFLGHFVAKGRFEPLLRGMPLRVALEPRAPLLGAAHYAADPPLSSRSSGNRDQL